MRRTSYHALLVVIALFAPAVYAQSEKASLSGLVNDKSGATVPEAQVVAENLATAVKTATKTNSTGGYYLLLLPGDYRIEASRQGFATVVVARLNLTVAQAATLDLTLDVSAIQQQVTVEAEAPLLEQEDPGLGTTIQSEKIVELPLLGRNPFSLVVLAPAVIPKGNAGTGPLINGGRSNANAIKNAIRVAAELSRAKLNEKIEQELSVVGVGAKR